MVSSGKDIYGALLGAIGLFDQFSAGVFRRIKRS